MFICIFQELDNKAALGGKPATRRADRHTGLFDKRHSLLPLIENDSQ
jgi:hypothetical protein